MIVVNIMGGLGNQMFQYACGQAIAAQTGHEVRYAVDTIGAFATARSLELERAFGIDLPVAGTRDLEGILGRWRAAPTVRRALARPEARLFRGKRFIAEQRFAFIPDLKARAAAGAYLHGYWQSARYFEERASQIAQSFTFQGKLDPSNQAVISRIADGPAIGIHIRRGDYVSNPAASAAHGALPGAFFIDTVRQLRATMPGARVFAFSDDPAWVKANLVEQVGNCECVSHNTGENSFRDMQLMARCDALVISNSSFSWWAAWLNARPEKIIIAPKQWFADPRLDGSAIVPDTWMRT
ncbi:alpha-1,2-fucosyltransferase [Martelella limonii]|uniref:alpha-1,2-fucosyltransferase n=1 Tax=Martelella limonii TaxID=1647649 RepID=UPI00157FE92C|nr:alpha-1,2-fucosyltransferase [Martelella limonii]